MIDNSITKLLTWDLARSSLLSIVLHVGVRGSLCQESSSSTRRSLRFKFPSTCKNWIIKKITRYLLFWM